MVTLVKELKDLLSSDIPLTAGESKVNAGYRVLTSEPTVISVDVTEGDPSELAHYTELDDTHAAVLHALLSTRLLGVLSL
jgi:hypothetical protein